MRWSVRVARLAGIDIKIHLTFLLLLGWIGAGYYAQGGASAAISGVVFILLLFGSVLLHELGHALAARRYGIHTPDITLLPIGGIARLQRIPREPRQELAIALAGPAVNVVIALALFLFLGSFAATGDTLLRLEDPGMGMAAKLLSANVILVLFNLIPAFPMDGGRILRAALALRLSYVRATQVAANAGQAFAFLFGFAGLFLNPLLLFIALFVYLGATQEAAAVEMQNVAERLPIATAMMTEFRTLAEDATLGDAVDLLLRTAQQDFPVVDGELRFRGVLTRSDLVAGLARGGPHLPLASVVRADVPTVNLETPFEEAFRRMQECRCPVLPVTDGRGRVVGLITPENVGEMVMIHSALARGQHPSWWPDSRSRTSDEVALPG